MLGKDLEVSPICLGRTADPNTIPAAFDAGINFFFLSGDLHWPIYLGLREGLSRLLQRTPSVRDQIVVAGVAYAGQRGFCLGAYAELIQAVPKLLRIDVAVAGGICAGDFARRASDLAIARQSFFGARATGASFHDRPEALAAINGSSVDVAFIRYHALHPGGRDDLLPHLDPKRKSKIFTFGSMMPTMYGPDQGPWPNFALTDYYRFAMTPPEIDGLLCAPQSPSEVTALCDTLARGRLDDEQERALMTHAQGRARLYVESNIRRAMATTP